MTTIPLCDLSPGAYALVERLDTLGQMRRRLLDLGLTPGAPVCCVGSSPGGDPAAYRVRQTILALRRADAATIWVRPVEEAESYGADQRSRGAGCGT
ncbi:MAG: ferrous iron transport protein A [Clostridia bacterium]|nr:ferrous iron transport protein A [Clostridia bacterium]